MNDLRGGVDLSVTKPMALTSDGAAAEMRHTVRTCTAHCQIGAEPKVSERLGRRTSPRKQ